jgi:hypothetical protein
LFAGLPSEWDIRFISAMVGGCQLKRVPVPSWTVILCVSEGVISDWLKVFKIS